MRQQIGRGELDVPGVPKSLAWQAFRFAIVGVLSTLAYLLLFSLARPSMGAQAANLVALLTTAVLNTAANRRFTFNAGKSGALRHQAQGLVVFALGLGLTSGALALLAAVSENPSRAVELSVLVVANLAATVLRFVLMREWVFRHRTPLANATTQEVTQ